MASKFDLGGAQFSGNYQVGDHNTMHNTFENQVSTMSGLSPEAKELIRGLRRSVQESPNVDADACKTFDSDLMSVAEEMSKPEDSRDQGRLLRYWKTVTSIAGKSATALAAATALGKVFGLPI